MSNSLLDSKRIVLGVSGSIACYKSADLASKLTQAGALVDVILTEAAQQFVTPLTFQAVTGRTVYSDLWNRDGHVQHVKLGESADLLLVSPATAHTLAKLAQGFADNFLTVTALAARCPVVVAPAMDGGMFAHPAVQENVALLRARGVVVIEPKEGRMASGLVGKGRLPETAEMIGHIRRVLGRNGVLAGKHVLISAGPTQEPIDPVRFISNHSSGKQGVALAQAAVDMGAEVTLITGRIHEPIPFGVNHVQIQTAVELHDAVMAVIQEQDILIMAAAVGDFRPKNPATQKIKKEMDGVPTIELTRNPDITVAVRAWKAVNHAELFMVGFAAETQNWLENGQSKLARKGLDLIAVNDVGGTQTGFRSATNAITLLGKDDLMIEIPLQSKEAVAEAIMKQVAKMLTV